VVGTEDEIRAELEAEAKEAIEELLGWARGRKAPNLMQIEDKVLALRERLGQRMSEALLEAQEARQPQEAPPCPECGQPMRYKGQKDSYVESRLGTLKVERGYYHCARCDSGLFPPRRADGPI